MNTRFRSTGGTGISATQSESVPLRKQTGLIHIAVTGTLVWAFSTTPCGFPMAHEKSHAEKNRSREQRMTTKTKINRVLEVREEPGKHRMSVVTDRSGTLWLDSSTLQKASLECVLGSRDKKRPVVIESDAKTGQVLRANYPLIDVIFFLSGVEDDKEIVRVTALKRPTQLVLRKDHPEFRELYAKLAEAFAERGKGRMAALAIPPGGDSIVDVELQPPDTHR